MSKHMEKATVSSQEELASGIYSLYLRAPMTAASAAAGQFVNVYCNDKSRLLPRPVSICEIKRTEGLIRLVYRVSGKGTDEFSKLKAGDEIDIIGPLGNGFIAASGIPANASNALLIGGGIGIPPMLELARSLQCRKSIVLGYRSGLFLFDDFEGSGELYLATEDGSYGIHGTVIDSINEHNICADVIYACGPAPMLRAVKKLASSSDIPAWLSLEERMACGVGACLGCVVPTTHKNEHSQVLNARVCADGPVFAASEVII